MKWAKLNFVARHSDPYVPGYKGHNGVRQNSTWPSLLCGDPHHSRQIRIFFFHVTSVLRYVGSHAAWQCHHKAQTPSFVTRQWLVHAVCSGLFMLSFLVCSRSCLYDHRSCCLFQSVHALGCNVWTSFILSVPVCSRSWLQCTILVHAVCSSLFTLLAAMYDPRSCCLF